MIFLVTNAKVTRPNQRVFDKGEYTSNYQNSKLKYLNFFNIAGKHLSYQYFNSKIIS